MATKRTFSIQEAIKFGWETFKKNWQFLVIVGVITALVSFIPSWLNDWAEGNLPGLRFIFTILGAIANIVVSIGGVVIALKLVDKKVPKLEDLYKHYPLLLNYFFASVLMALIFIGGLILLVVPAFYFAVKYHFLLYYVIDKKMGPIEALKASGKITEGVKWKLVGFTLVCVAISILGFLAFGIGMLVAIPVISLADTYLYRKLSRTE